MTTKAEPRQIVLMLFNIDVIFTHFILLFSRFDVISAYGLIKFCKKRARRPILLCPRFSGVARVVRSTKGGGLWYRPGTAKRPGFRRFKRFRGFRGEGIAFGDEYIVSVTGLASRPTVILSRRRRISVPTAYETNAVKYRSAGKLPYAYL